MPRQRKRRHIRGCIRSNFFKPQAVPISKLEIITLEIDEVEAIRLTEYEKMPLREASEQMQISKSTLHRILEQAQFKVADALINGKAIKIANKNNFLNFTPNNMPNKDGTGPDGKGPRTGRGMGNCPPAEGQSSDQPPRRGCGRRPRQNRG